MPILYNFAFFYFKQNKEKQSEGNSNSLHATGLEVLEMLYSYLIYYILHPVTYEIAGKMGGVFWADIF